MQNIKKIMCVIDPTTTTQTAMSRAAWLAGKTGAELELLVCYYNEYLTGERLFDSPSLQKAREEIILGHQEHLETLAEPLRSSGLTVRTTAIWDHPLYEGIVRHAAAVRADIVFKDTHHHSALARAFLGNTDWNLIRTCAAPLWLVKPRDIASKPIVVAAVDPMHEHDKPAALDDAILELGKMLVETAGAELRAFHSYDPQLAIAGAVADAYVPVALPFDDLERQVVADHTKRFEQFAAKHGIDPESSKLASGLIHLELPAYCADMKADVVLMGAVSRNRWKRLFIGASAERTLEHLPCDLLIVKPHGIAVPAEISADRAA